MCLFVCLRVCLLRATGGRASGFFGLRDKGLMLRG